jgi:hypothetical protein
MLKYDYHIKSMRLYYKKYYPITYNELKFTTNYSNKKIIYLIKSYIYKDL